MTRLSLDGPSPAITGAVTALLAVFALARRQTRRSYGVLKKCYTNSDWSRCFYGRKQGDRLTDKPNLENFVGPSELAGLWLVDRHEYWAFG